MAGNKNSGPRKQVMNPKRKQAVIEQIEVTKIVKRLQKHLLGKIEMSATQLKAAEILLRKTIPDLRTVEHSGNIKVSHEDMTREELDARLLTNGIDPERVDDILEGDYQRLN